MLKMLVVAVTLLALSSCAQRAVDKMEKAHAVVAKEADIAAGFMLKVACHAPPDALVRWCSSSDQCLAIWYGCPDLRSLIGAITAALATRTEFHLLLEPIEVPDRQVE